MVKWGILPVGAIRWVDEFADKDGQRFTKVQQQDIACSVGEMHGGGVGSRRVVGIQRVSFHPIHERDNLVGAAYIDVVVQASVTKKLHANAGREVERRIGTQQAPDTE